MSGLGPRDLADRGRRPTRRSLVLLLLGVGGALVLLGCVALAALRYLPALDEARALREDLRTMLSQVEQAGVEIDSAQLDTVTADAASARRRLARLSDVLHDPIMSAAQALPAAGPNVRGAQLVVTAAGSVLDAADLGIGIARRYVEIRTAQTAAEPGSSMLPSLVALLATSRGNAAAASADVHRAREALREVPDGLFEQIDGARDEMLSSLDRYGPLLDELVTVADRVPPILGSQAPRRYLVLAQDPAELRPSGGFIGTYGVVTIDRGQITSRSFRNVTALDDPVDYPMIEPPQALADYLLGPRQTWQLSDAGWSPDFPTSARDALRLYSNESGDTAIDGVIGITTYTIDELLNVTGPIAMPEWGTTVAAGETTLKVLQSTRSTGVRGDGKAMLSVFADRLLSSLLALRPSVWPQLLDTAQSLRESHLFLVWMRDPADNDFVATRGFSGAVRQDPGDYLFPVDSNVAPASKLDLVTRRSLDLDVRLDGYGNARDTLQVTWANDVLLPQNSAYRSMDGTGGLVLGMYFRALVPDRSRVETMAGGGLTPVTEPSEVATESGRLAIGSYLKIPPGTTALSATWTSPYAADVGATGGTYRLTIQQQPGAQASPVSVTIVVPDGYRITAVSPGLTVAGQTATLSTTLSHDLELAVRYSR